MTGDNYILQLVPDPREGLNDVQGQLVALRHKFDKEQCLIAQVFRSQANSRKLPLGVIYTQFLRLIYHISRYPLFKCLHDFSWLLNFPSEDSHILELKSFEEFLSTKLFPEFSEFGRDVFRDLYYYWDSSKDIEKQILAHKQYFPTPFPVSLPPYLISGNCFDRFNATCNIPPHNLAEVIDALLAKIDNPKLNSKQLLEFIKGPEFARAEVNMDDPNLIEAYCTGKGSFSLKTKIDDLHLIEHSDACTEGNILRTENGKIHFIERNEKINFDMTVLINEKPVRLPLESMLQRFIDARMISIQETRKCSKRRAYKVFVEDLHHFKRKYGLARTQA